MQNLTSRFLALGLFALALPAQPALAREHSHHVYRHHHRVYQAFAYRHRYAHRYGFRHGYAMEQQNVSGFSPFGQSWRQGGNQSWGQSRGESMRRSSGYDGMVAQQASANGIPVSLVERVIKRESGGNARAVSRGNYGLMQIRLGTARSMGYSGSAAGLLDASTNMTYAVRYLAGAYRAAGGSEGRAVALYARGYGARGYSAPRVQTASFYGDSSGSYQPSFGANRAAPTRFGYFARYRHRRVAYRVRHFRHHPV